MLNRMRIGLTTLREHLRVVNDFGAQRDFRKMQDGPST